MGKAHNGTATPKGPAREWVTFADPTDEGRTWQVDVTFLLSSWECIFGCGCQGIWTAPTPELVHGCCTYGAHFTDKSDRDHVAKVAKTLTADEWQFAKRGRKHGIFEKVVPEPDDEPGPTEWKTTGKPKGVQRDTGGYAVALASIMKHIFGGDAGETYFSTSDIGWVVGHSYIVYGPLIAGMATIMYEGLPIRPDAGVWWSIVEKYKVTRDVHRADRGARAEETGSGVHAEIRPVVAECPVPGRRAAGRNDRELDRRGAGRAGHRQLLADRDRLADPYRSRRRRGTPSKLGSPALPMYGYDVKLVARAHRRGAEGADEKGVVVIEARCRRVACRRLGRRRTLCQDLLAQLPGEQVYSTFDWGIRDADGYYFILGRTDDVINVAGHRLGTREIEESIRVIRMSRKSRWSASPTSSRASRDGFRCRARMRRGLADAEARAASSKAKS